MLEGERGVGKAFDEFLLGICDIEDPLDDFCADGVESQGDENDRNRDFECEDDGAGPVGVGRCGRGARFAGILAIDECGGRGPTAGDESAEETCLDEERQAEHFVDEMYDELY